MSVAARAGNRSVTLLIETKGSLAAILAHESNSDFATNGSSRSANRPLEDNLEKRNTSRKLSISRRSFLGKTVALGAGTVGAGMLTSIRTAEASGGLSPGDAALLRFPAALELLEADFWIQYNELGGTQDDEVPGGQWNEAYTDALEVIEDEMQDYIHDNTDDEITHHQFLNAYLVSKGAGPANLDAFRTLMGSTATGVNPDLIGKRLTNLTQLTWIPVGGPAIATTSITRISIRTLSFRRRSRLWR